jgi:hypothetical protein
MSTVYVVIVQNGDAEITQIKTYRQHESAVKFADSIYQQQGQALIEEWKRAKAVGGTVSIKESKSAEDEVVLDISGSKSGGIYTTRDSAEWFKSWWEDLTPETSCGPDFYWFGFRSKYNRISIRVVFVRALIQRGRLY